MPLRQHLVRTKGHKEAIERTCTIVLSLMPASPSLCMAQYCQKSGISWTPPCSAPAFTAAPSKHSASPTRRGACISAQMATAVRARACWLIRCSAALDAAFAQPDCTAQPDCSCERSTLSQARSPRVASCRAPHRDVHGPALHAPTAHSFIGSTRVRDRLSLAGYVLQG